MKYQKILFAILIASGINLFAQTGSINNTLGTGGSFIVKDGTDNFLRVDQLTGNAIFLRNLELGNQDNSTQSIGLITKNGIRFMHNSKPVTSDGNNTFVGLYAGNFFNYASSGTYWGSYNTAIGFGSLAALTMGYSNSAMGWGSLTSNDEGYQNSAFGDGSLYSNTTGHANSAFGYHALFSNDYHSENSAFWDGSLYSNATGDGNAAFGYHTLFSNLGGYSNSAFGQEALYFSNGLWNSAFGFQSLYSNTANNNSAFGNRSLYSNTSGEGNNAFGSQALFSNMIGRNNSAFGFEALKSADSDFNSAFGFKALTSATGNRNSAFGYAALFENTNGSYNTAIGHLAGFGITTGSNNICIGYDAQVGSTFNNQVRIGNSAIDYASIQVAWSITSDKRWKENIHPSKLGLNFISKLNPVAYTRKNDENQKIEYGLIAQELEQVLKEEGVINSAMLTTDGEGRYELRYNDLFAPIIKAIQELKNQNDELFAINKQFVEQNLALKKEIEKVQLTISEKIDEKIKSFLTQISESENSNLNIALEK